ncbi:hypothetical protein [Amycolatopsis sp. CA-126428]|uniref:hypothetical protein n=1 Tax=Amycolatopsis sp. CA-126428 TaxID=2073158 RepID=UPI0011B0E0A7|nr:hypothetical protein [Amycolatopsis sp. CA-126428]
MRVDGRAVGTVRRVTAGVLDRYEPRNLGGSVLRPDLPDVNQPRYDSVYALIARTADRDLAADAVAPGHP